MDLLSPGEELSAGAYADLARASLADISGRGAMAFLVGGTGFYLRSLLEGLSDAPGRHVELRRRLGGLAGRRPGALHRFLQRKDAAAARRIHANDHQKLIRAIELATVGEPLSPRMPLAGYRVLKLGLNPPRTELYERLNWRSELMFEGGLLEETARIPAGSKGLQALGYKQALAVLENRMTRAEAVLELQVRTRQYAKRQMTWFRRETGMQWLEGFGDGEECSGGRWSW